VAKALREVTRWWDGLTDYHAKYLAYELTKRCASDNVEKLASVLYDSPAAMHTGEWESPQVRRSEAQKRRQGASGSGYWGICWSCILPLHTTKTARRARGWPSRYEWSRGNQWRWCSSIR
jgi:hypothetical protein